ncbi:MAG: DoxX family protein [Gammaproteobacteria bacterium]|nr:DoxX family protein [Gammaproteobacteria bacterium]
MSAKAQSTAVADFVARLFLSSIFVYAVIGKITNYHATAAYMTAFGVSTALLPVVIVVELLGSLCLIFGFMTRIAAAVLAVFSLAAIVIFHHVLNNQAAIIVALAELAFTGGLMQLAIHGAGCISIDHYRRRT